METKLPKFNGKLTNCDKAGDVCKMVQCSGYIHFVKGRENLHCPNLN